MQNTLEPFQRQASSRGKHRLKTAVKGKDARRTSYARLHLSRLKPLKKKQILWARAMSPNLISVINAGEGRRTILFCQEQKHTRTRRLSSRGYTRENDSSVTDHGLTRTLSRSKGPSIGLLLVRSFGNPTRIIPAIKAP